MLLWVVAVVGFIVVIAVVGRTLFANYSTDLSKPWGTWWDLRDAGYFPVRAVLDGIIPYDVGRYMGTYPVAQEFPLLPPTYLLLHAPLQLFSLTTASLLVFGLNILGIGVLSAWSLSLARYRVTPLQILTVTTLAIASTGGRNLLFSGQASLIFVAGTYLAVTASGDGAGAIGVFVALIKPAFGIPVTLLVAAMGRCRRAIVGALTAAGVSAVLMVPFVAWAGGVGPLFRILADNVAFSAGSPGVDLGTATGRVDAASAIAKVFGVIPPPGIELVFTGVIVGGAMVILFAKRSAFTHGPAVDAAIVLICLVLLTGIYHSVYDLIVLLLPAMLLIRDDFAGSAAPRGLRLATFGAILLAGYNPFKVDSVARLVSDSPRLLEVLGPGLTAAALLVALVLATVAVWGIPTRATGRDAVVEGA